MHPTRRRVLQRLVGSAGSFVVVGALGRQDGWSAIARSDDDDNPDDSGGGDESGHGGSGHDDSGAMVVAVTGEIPPGSVEIRIVSEDADGFQPREVTVDLGQSVSFVNAQDDEHTATGSGFDTGVIDRGQVVTIVFDEPGVFPYACQFHPVMTGSVGVRGADGIVPRPPAQTGTPTADAITVTIANLAFDPAEVTVPTGSTVAWTNNDSVPHTVTSVDGAFDSGIFDPGAIFSWTFDQPGSFSYVCQLHPQMQGAVIAEGEPTASATPTGVRATPSAAGATPTGSSTAQQADPGTGDVDIAIVDFAFEPATLDVPVGTTVIWTNTGQAPHTVTRSFADSGTLSPGQTYRHTFAEAGAFDYVCSFHPQMTGRLQVATSATG